MASWEQFQDYVRSNHMIAEELPEAVSMVLETRRGRTQMVFITHHTLQRGSEDWIVIESPFGELGAVDLEEAVTAAGKMVCGGIGLYQNRFLTVRHAVPLENLDENEFARPLHLVSHSADSLEARLTGQDRL